MKNEALYQTGEQPKEIPEEFRSVGVLPNGKKQIIDIRLCYNWDPAPDGGELVPCGSVAAHADT